MKRPASSAPQASTSSLPPRPLSPLSTPSASPSTSPPSTTLTDIDESVKTCEAIDRADAQCKLVVVGGLKGKIRRRWCKIHENEQKNVRAEYKSWLLSLLFLSQLNSQFHNRMLYVPHNPILTNSSLLRTTSINQINTTSIRPQPLGKMGAPMSDQMDSGRQSSAMFRLLHRSLRRSRTRRRIWIRRRAEQTPTNETRDRKSP